MEARWCDEFEHGFGWIAEERIARASHCLRVGDEAWLVDPLDTPGLDDRVRALGKPRGVIQLLDRHDRDCAALAARLDVPHHEVPATVPDTPFEFVPIRSGRTWKEVALWWAEARVLVCGDALGTVAYFVAPGERLGVHPLLRFRPPTSLKGLSPGHVLCGHGEAVHGEGVPALLDEALATARRRLPAAYLNSARYFLRRG